MNLKAACVHTRTPVDHRLFRDEIVFDRRDQIRGLLNSRHGISNYTTKFLESLEEEFRGNLSELILLRNITVPKEGYINIAGNNHKLGVGSEAILDHQYAIEVVKKLDELKPYSSEKLRSHLSMFSFNEVKILLKFIRSLEEFEKTGKDNLFYFELGSKTKMVTEGVISVGINGYLFGSHDIVLNHGSAMGLVNSLDRFETYSKDELCKLFDAIPGKSNGRHNEIILNLLQIPKTNLSKPNGVIINGGPIIWTSDCNKTPDHISSTAHSYSLGSGAQTPVHNIIPVDYGGVVLLREKKVHLIEHK